MPHAVLVCCHAAQPAFVDRLIRIHEPYPWVAAIFLLDTSADGGAEQHGKVCRISENFGYGFDKQPELGGYDEITAREVGLDFAGRAAAACGVGWLVALDADEILAANFDEVLQRADEARANAVSVECRELINPETYLFHRERVHGPNKLYDPHVRAFRADRHAWRYLPSPFLQPDWPNRTKHCRPLLGENEMVYQAPGFYHFHVKARDTRTPRAKRPLPQPVPEDWFQF